MKVLVLIIAAGIIAFQPHNNTGQVITSAVFGSIAFAFAYKADTAIHHFAYQILNFLIWLQNYLTQNK